MMCIDDVYRSITRHVAKSGDSSKVHFQALLEILYRHYWGRGVCVSVTIAV